MLLAGLQTTAQAVGPDVGQPPGECAPRIAPLAGPLLTAVHAAAGRRARPKEAAQEGGLAGQGARDVVQREGLEDRKIPLGQATRNAAEAQSKARLGHQAYRVGFPVPAEPPRLTRVAVARAPQLPTADTLGRVAWADLENQVNPRQEAKAS